MSSFLPVRTRLGLAGWPTALWQRGLGRGLTIARHMERPHGEAAARVRDSTLEGTRALLVDDQPDTVDMTALVLRAAGAEVSTACSVDAAARVFSSLALDVILTDIALPQKDGFELLRLVRGLPSPASRLPVIALTAYAGARDAERMTRAGFAHHAAKPIACDNLIRIIAEVVRASRARS